MWGAVEEDATEDATMSGEDPAGAPMRGAVDEDATGCAAWRANSRQNAPRKRRR
jgi:hypothetical protein